MPTVFDEAGFPAPGVVQFSPSGRLGAVVHAGFPGVLLGVWDAVGSNITIERFTLGERRAEWVTVRSGGPVWLSSGVGSAYDLEAEYGKTYMYRLGYYYGEGGEAEHRVTVRMPDWDGGTGRVRFTGWLKSLTDPLLSRAVVVEQPGEFTRSAHQASATRWGNPYPTTVWGGRAARTGSLVFHGLPGDDVDALEELLSSGLLLFQPKPSLKARPMYLLPGDLSDLHYSMEMARQFTLSFTEVDRPADLDTPPVIPGWSWDEATEGMSLGMVDGTFQDEWAMLLAGVQGWDPDAGAA